MNNIHEYIKIDALTPSQLAKLHRVVDLSMEDARLKTLRSWTCISSSGGQKGSLRNIDQVNYYVNCCIEKCQSRLKAAREAEEEHRREELRRKQEEQRRQQENRFRRLVSLFVVAAKMAKVDGHVDASEVKVAERLFLRFNIKAEERNRYVYAFNAAIKSNENVYDYADKIARLFPLEIKLFIYELLWDIACADGIIVDEELTLLKVLCSRLGLLSYIYDNNFRKRQSFYRSSRDSASTGDDRKSNNGNSSNTGSRDGGHKKNPSSDGGLEWAYAMIGGNASMSNDELKAAYRAQAKAYHPDILKAKGIPEDLIEIANAKMVKLNDAWTTIRKTRAI